MTLAQIRYAVAVDDHRHFGRAAAACHVAQPTLSAQLRKLEDQLGVALFDRARKPVAPTDLGARLLAQMRIALGEVERVPAIVQEVRGEVRGELRLGVIPTLASCLLPVVTGPFTTRHPDAALRIHEMTTSRVIQQVATGAIDAGLIATEDLPSALVSDALYTEPFVAYVGAGHWAEAEATVACERLSPDDMWLLSEGHCFRDQVLHLCRAHAEASGPAGQRTLFESGNIETLRRMVDRSGGMTLLPLMATLYMTDGQRERLRPLDAPPPSRTVRMVYGRAYLKRALIDAYAETVQDAVRTIDGVEPVGG